MEVFYREGNQRLNKLLKIKLEESMGEPPTPCVCCLDDLEVCLLLSFMRVVCAECAKHLLSLL